MPPTMKMTYNGGAAVYATALHDKLSKIVKKTARDVSAEAAVEIMQGEKTGRVYMHGKVAHQASAPGEAPATDTGNLVNSINVTDDSDLTSTVNVGSEYGLYLEMGTVHMAPRPFMQPSMDSVEPSFIAACEAAIATA